MPTKPHQVSPSLAQSHLLHPTSTHPTSNLPTTSTHPVTPSFTLHPQSRPVPSPTRIQLHIWPVLVLDVESCRGFWAGRITWQQAAPGALWRAQGRDGPSDGNLMLPTDTGAVACHTLHLIHVQHALCPATVPRHVSVLSNSLGQHARHTAAVKSAEQACAVARALTSCWEQVCRDAMLVLLRPASTAARSGAQSLTVRVLTAQSMASQLPAGAITFAIWPFLIFKTYYAPPRADADQPLTAALSTARSRISRTGHLSA